MAASLQGEPSPRLSPFATSAAGQTYVYGGFVPNDGSDSDDDDGDYPGVDEGPETVYKFSQKEEIWKKHTTTLSSGYFPPPKIMNGACTSVGDTVYLYGGMNDNYISGGLYSLDTRQMKWRKVSNGPVETMGCGIVHFRNKLIIFGGYGPQPVPTQPGATYLPEDEDLGGYNNELHIFDLKEESWSSPEVTGTRPPPCSNFTFVPIDKKSVLLFGGDQGDKLSVSNDAYILDMEAMHWTKLDYPEGEPCPSARKYHTAVCLSQGSRPQLVVFGGTDRDQDVLTEDTVWILDVETRRWKEIQHPNLKGRYQHIATAISLGKGLTEVTVFGGFQDLRIQLRIVSNTAVLRFEQNKTTREWELVDVADSSQLGTPDRLKTKEEKIAHHGAPEYKLDDDYVEAQAGESPTLHFSVTSDPPLTENTTHDITAENGGIVRRFKVQNNCITFRNVKTTDTGSYTISCRNVKGLEGKATFEMDISESAGTGDCRIFAKSKKCEVFLIWHIQYNFVGST